MNGRLTWLLNAYFFLLISAASVLSVVSLLIQKAISRLGK